MRSALDRFFGRLVRTGLDDVRIGDSAASAGTHGTACAFVRSATGATEIAADGDDGAGTEINVEFVVVTVGDGAFFVVNCREHDASRRLHGAGVGYVHHFRHSAGDGERGAGLHRD